MKLSAALFAMAALLVEAAPAIADLKMGVFPRRPVAATHQTFQPLAEHLSQALGEKVELVVAKDFKSFWAGVAAGEYDLVHFNQYHYIKSHKEFGYRVIVANEEFGERTIAGALAVRKDSGVNSVTDLKGKTILFGGGTKAMGSYIAPTSLLKKAGLNEGADYKANFAKNPPSAVIGVYNKAADAAGAGNVILRLKSVQSQIDSEQMKILAETEPYAQLPWAVKAGMTEEKAQKIQSIMTSLKTTPAGQDVLKSAKVTDFFAVTDTDYNNVREIVLFATGEEY